MSKSIHVSLTPFLINGAKTVIYLTAALYSLAFAYAGVNIFGKIDALIPFERVMLGFLGVVFLSLTVRYSKRFGKNYMEIIKK